MRFDGLWERNTHGLFVSGEQLHWMCGQIQLMYITVILGGGFKYFYVHPENWGRLSILTNIFRMG